MVTPLTGTPQPLLLRDRPAARRRLRKASGDRDGTAGRAVPGRCARAGSRRAVAGRTSGPGRHRQNPARCGVRPHALERPSRRDAGLGERHQPGRHRERVRAGGPGHRGSDTDQSANAGAEAFLAWLAHTRRPWALIMDDLGDLADMEDLWPSGQAGQVVITTRLPGTAFGHVPTPGHAGGPRIAPVGGFSRREALSYLTVRLTEHTDQRAEALDLDEDLDGLPLAIAQAAAVMSVTDLSCRDYLVRLRERREHMAGVLVEGVSPAVLATWSLAAECAHRLPPAGVAWPALALAAMFDPHGIPGAVLTSPAACGYVAGRPSTGTEADQSLVLAAVTNLGRAEPGQHRPGHPRPHGADAPQRAERGARLPAAGRAGAGRAGRGGRAQPGLAGGGWRAAAGAGLPGLHRGAVVGEHHDRAAARCPRGPGTAGPGQWAQGQQAQGQQARWPRIQAQNPLWTPEAHPLLFRRGRSLEDARLG